MTNDDQIEELYQKIMYNVSTLLREYDPLAVAAVMMAQSLSMYRTTLSEDDYNSMVQGIVDKKDKVRTFGNKGMLH